MANGVYFFFLQRFYLQSTSSSPCTLLLPPPPPFATLTVAMAIAVPKLRQVTVTQVVNQLQLVIQG